MVTSKDGSEIDEYMQGAIDGLLSIEELPMYDTVFEGGEIGLIFSEVIPLKAFARLMQFIEKIDNGYELYLIPNNENKVVIKYFKTI